MTRNKILLALFMGVALFMNVLAQDVLLTIDDKEITLDEFERIYKKNNRGISADTQTPEEYLDLFINFKLKVIEAEKMGMDTTAKFLKEFNGYKEQLAKPYLEDKETKLEFMKEAYERMKWDMHVKHILLKMPNQYTPEDTVVRYNQALKIRQRILEGEDFSTVARATSDDPGVKMNGGDMGWFTAFTFPYSFETTAYNTKIGEVAMPIRTIYGYNIIKKIDQRPAAGQIKVAHVFLRAPETSSKEMLDKTQELANSIYDSLNMGVDFGTLARRYSDDKGSASKGGELPWFETGKMIKDFEDQAFALKEIGDYCKPFQTYYGWHIIKLLDKKPVGSYEEMESVIASKSVSGDRGRVLENRYLAKLKKRYQYKLDEDIYKLVLANVDTLIFYDAWDPDKNTDHFEDYLFTYNGGGGTLKEFSYYLAENQNKRPVISIENYVESKYNRFLQEYMKSLEKESLPERYPEYKYILQEYHDGILLFDLMDKMVWTKAVNDTSGLETFFEQHRDNYMWKSRMEAIIVTCDSGVDVSALVKKAAKIGSGKWDETKLNEKFCKDSIDCITLEKVTVEKGINENVDALNETPGTGKVFVNDGKSKFVIGTKLIPPVKKELNETKGLVTSDYQDYLEKKWLEELHTKYKIKVNKELLSKIN